PDAVTKFGCGEIGRSGSSTSAAVSALSSLVKATLTVSTFPSPGECDAGGTKQMYSVHTEGSTRRVLFSAATAFWIAARSGAEATILRLARRTPFRRPSLIAAMASPRTKLPNSGTKRFLGTWPPAQTPTSPQDNGPHPLANRSLTIPGRPKNGLR